ncbi:NADP-dependent oxidoreductase [Paenibacillus sp. SI8]|uniref:NADP-dependent oxidoreductase n=1 Tax=unclassified Paenibacillus TaxID=185978 RepID=UPI003467369F
MSNEIESAQTIKAVRIHAFGSTEVLTNEEIPRPIAGKGEVLVQIRAVGVNPGDWRVRSGHADIPAELRPPVSVPLPFILGNDISGTVAAVGPDVTHFQVGDAVYGMIGFPDKGGAYAEYAAVPSKELALKPSTIDFVHAAGVPMAALTAWQGLFEKITLKKGQTVLVNGAAGGVGHIAVQLAKIHGANVIGVASGAKEKFVRELGADEFIDYTTSSIETSAKDVDVVIDTVGGDHRLLEVLKPGGVLIPVFPGSYTDASAAEKSISIKWYQVYANAAHLASIGNLIDSGKLHVVIEAVLPLASAAKAHELSESRRVSGKIVLEVAE